MNKYVIILFAILAFGVKFLFEYFQVNESNFYFPPILKKILFGIFMLAAMNVFVFIVISLFTKIKSEKWWENEANQQEKIKKERRLQIYILSLAISFVIVVYGSISYIAIARSRRMIFVFIGLMLIYLLIGYFRKEKSQQMKENQQ